MKTNVEVTVTLELSPEELCVIYAGLMKKPMESTELQLARKLAKQLEKELHCG